MRRRWQLASRDGWIRSVPKRGHVARVGLAGLVALICGCATAPSTGLEAQLRTAPAGTYVTGAPSGLGAPEIVNRRDFVYALAFDDHTERLAFVHHVSTEMEVTVTRLSPLQPVFQEKLNKNQFDNEDVLFDGDRLLVPSRQGILRALAADDGRRLAEVSVGEGLLRVAASPTGVYVATTDGRVLVFSRALGLVGEGLVHDDEVRGLGVLPDGRLVTASMDGLLKVHTLVPATVPAVRLPLSPLPSGVQVFLTHVGGQRAIATARDARGEATVISRAAVKRLGLRPQEAGAERTIITAEGERQVPVVEVGELRLRSLSLRDVTAAVCDDCVPAGVELVLGADVLRRVVLVEDIASGDLVARAPARADEAPRPDDAALTPGAVTLSTERVIELPGPANDVDIAMDKVLVTFSHQKAERDYDLYEKEKKGELPPPSIRSGAALVDVESGTLSRQFVNQHLGFTVTGALSRDGRTVATGGWDRRVLLWDTETGEVVTERSFAWLVRRVRFSTDNSRLGVAAWTPVNAFNAGDSEPALVLYPLQLASPELRRP
jgi:WD40 repeat protein